MAVVWGVVWGVLLGMVRWHVVHVMVGDLSLLRVVFPRPLSIPINNMHWHLAPVRLYSGLLCLVCWLALLHAFFSCRH